MSIEDLPLKQYGKTRMISPENPTGAPGAGGRWHPDPSDPYLPHSKAAVNLGQGWKVRPFVTLPARSTITLAEVSGPGVIRYLWCTTDLLTLRGVILRMYWDDESEPSVEVPLGDFFAMGHDGFPHTVISEPVVVAPHRAFNCYWSMPFRQGARVTVENTTDVDGDIFAFKLVYEERAVADSALYFHANWRHTSTTIEHPLHTIIDNVEGRGLYVGTSMSWTAASSGWWGEGEVKFYLDDDKEFPSIIDSGTEDYFGGAWSYFREGLADQREQAFNAPYFGLPLAKLDDEKGPRRFSMYRWHINDPIPFIRSFRATVQALGWYPDETYRPLADDVASVAFWYQDEPHFKLSPLQPLQKRWVV